MQFCRVRHSEVPRGRGKNWPFSLRFLGQPRAFPCQRLRCPRARWVQWPATAGSCGLRDFPAVEARDVCRAAVRPWGAVAGDRARFSSGRAHERAWLRAWGTRGDYAYAAWRGDWGPGDPRKRRPAARLLVSGGTAHRHGLLARRRGRQSVVLHPK